MLLKVKAYSGYKANETVKSQKLPYVLESGLNDNVYLFIVGHGGTSGVYLDTKDSKNESDVRLTPSLLAKTIDEMYQGKKYRRLLMVVEACHAGTLGKDLKSPGMLLITGANPWENSLGTNYDHHLDAWLADEFAYQLWKEASSHSEKSIRHIYEHLYKSVPGSHVSLYNLANFGNIDQIELFEFLDPRETKSDNH